MLGDIGQTVLSAVADYWPLVLIAIGVTLLFQISKKTK